MWGGGRGDVSYWGPGTAPDDLSGYSYNVCIYVVDPLELVYPAEVEAEMNFIANFWSVPHSPAI